MPNLHDLLTEAQHGEAMVVLGDQFGLSPQETEAAVSALLPAISTGLKQSTATPEGLGNLFAVMGQQQVLPAMYDDPEAAFTQQGVAAGNNVLSAIFGTPEVSRAVAARAGEFSGVGSDVLKKMLPVLAGILMSGLMGSKSGSATPQAPAPSQEQPGGALGDILGQIFGRAGAPQTSPQPIPQSAPTPVPSGQTEPLPGGPAPGGDILGQILTEFQKGIQEGRIKPVIIGPMQIPLPGGQQGQAPGGDVLGQILRDILGGVQQQQPGGQPSGQPNKDLSNMSRQLGLMGDAGGGGVGEKVFGDLFEPGADIPQDQLDDIQRIMEGFGSRH